MEQKYNWAIKVVMELLDGNGNVESITTEIRPCSSEQDARTRHGAIQDQVTRPGRKHPKWQRLGGSALLRQPVGAWETVDDDEEIGRRIDAVAAEGQAAKA